MSLQFSAYFQKLAGRTVESATCAEDGPNGREQITVRFTDGTVWLLWSWERHALDTQIFVAETGKGETHE